MAGIYTASAVALIFALWAAHVRKRERDGEWREAPWVDGKMRRWAGRWEYREMADPEHREARDSKVW